MICFGVQGFPPCHLPVTGDCLQDNSSPKRTRTGWVSDMMVSTSMNLSPSFSSLDGHCWHLHWAKMTQRKYVYCKIYLYRAWEHNKREWENSLGYMELPATPHPSLFKSDTGNTEKLPILPHSLPVTFGRTVGTSPSSTSPVLPSMESLSPFSRTRSPIFNLPAASSISRCPHEI